MMTADGVIVAFANTEDSDSKTSIVGCVLRESQITLNFVVVHEAWPRSNQRGLCFL
jgi:hypothetical protein